MDLISLGMEWNVPAEIIAAELGESANFVNNIINDITNKIRTTEYLRYAPITLQ